MKLISFEVYEHRDRTLWPHLDGDFYDVVWDQTSKLVFYVVYWQVSRGAQAVVDEHREERT